MKKVAVGILRENSRVLLCQRKKSARYGLKWEFPGGKVESGESAVQCLNREFSEELGIEIEVGDLYHRQEYVYPDSGSFEILYYLISSYRGEVENRAFESVKWVKEDEFGSIDVLEGNRDVIQKIISDRGNRMR